MALAAWPEPTNELGPENRDDAAAAGSRHMHHAAVAAQQEIANGQQPLEIRKPAAPDARGNGVWNPDILPPPSATVVDHDHKLHRPRQYFECGAEVLVAPAADGVTSATIDGKDRPTTIARLAKRPQRPGARCLIEPELWNARPCEPGQGFQGVS